MSIKVGDFGWGKQKKTLSDLNSFGGTFHYQSPEIVSIPIKPYSYRTDVW
jgi:serine/threonine protein kinase